MAASSPLDTLFLPLQRGDLPWAGKTLFLGADWHPALAAAPVAPACWQIFKPVADQLVSHNLHTLVTLPNDTYGTILCAIPKQVDEAKFWIARGLSVLSPGGRFIAAAANDAGGARLEKWFREAGLTDIQSDSKNKARVVWGTKGPPVPTLTDWHKNGDVRLHDFGGGHEFYTQPGLFSWDRLDPASLLLAHNFSPVLSGHGADFGCGYGYLSYAALKNHPRIASMVLVDADARALECAHKNIASAQTDRGIDYLWQDASKSVSCPQPLDFVLMNPPFHTGKNTDIDLGRGFIASAAACLKKGGSLSLVANTHLPYEAVLEPLFKNVKLVVQKNGFKIIRAVK